MPRKSLGIGQDFLLSKTVIQLMNVLIEDATGDYMIKESGLISTHRYQGGQLCQRTNIPA